ncbi:MAG: uroporphyrinogen decarboxylase [Chitinivibrionales bacterium]|nr:uroporphyrinogen decarboxylase [Chitinivibrionales bacterium]MBD3394700.1 uroporphyrinogen decarboxylase [Chitinivibrionales bacterium]
MNSRELVTRAIKGEHVDRVPWVPFTGCHAYALIGKPARLYCKSEEDIVAGLNESIKRYQPDGVPVAFDLQIEAEILGCELVWADENPPAVTGHPLANGHKLASLQIPRPDQGRLKPVLAAARALREQHPDIALYGLVTGPFTLGLHLLGTDIFMKMFEDPGGVHELLSFCRDVCMAVTGYYLEAGCDIIAVVDPMTSQIGPDQFAQFVTPHAAPVFEHIRKSGGLGSFFVCGHAQQNIEAMCDCRPDNVSIDENIPLDYVRDVCRERDISFGGNMQLTVVLLLGSEIDAQRNALSCLDVGGTEGYLLAPGCDLPYATPPANLEAVTRLVRDPYQRDVVRAMEEEDTGGTLLDMSQYGQADKVVVDIITLDSESCAPCQYMVESVRKVVPQFEGIVEWREHKIKERESLTLMASLMVKNIPTICIDGTITFVSRIPRKEELIAAIQKRIYEKLRMRIRTRRGELLVLGKTRDECRGVRPAIDQAMSELGIEVPVREIVGEREALAYGAVQTPAIVATAYRLKAQGENVQVAAVKEWLKEIA